MNFLSKIPTNASAGNIFDRSVFSPLQDSSVQQSGAMPSHGPLAAPECHDPKQLAKTIENIDSTLRNLDIESHTMVMYSLATNFVTRRSLSSSMSKDTDSIFDTAFGPALGMRRPAGLEAFEDLFAQLDETLAAINRHSLRNHQNWALAIQKIRGMVEGDTNATELVDAVNEGAYLSNHMGRPIILPNLGPKHQQVGSIAPIRPLDIKSLNIPTGTPSEYQAAHVIPDKVVVEYGGGLELTEEEIAKLQVSLLLIH